MADPYEEFLSRLAARIDHIQGWLDRTAGRALFEIARDHAPVATVVELGSWKGRSTAWLAHGLKARGEGRLYAVDTWQGTPGEVEHRKLLAGYGPDDLFKEFHRNMAEMELADLVHPVRATTQEAARAWDGQPIGALFIDASHEYVDVRRDFELWSPFVAPGGIVAFDDAHSWHGPARLVTELPKWYSFAGLAPNMVFAVRARD